MGFPGSQAKVQSLVDEHYEALYRNAYRHRLRTSQHPRLLPLQDMGDFAEPPENLPEVEPQKLQEALSELPEMFRTPVIMFYFEEFSYRDIAEQMEVPLGTVMSRLARAKAYLRNRLFPPAPVAADGQGRAGDGM